ncbi:M14 family zinc carboxypeptidase [Nonomuraea sp. NPDC050556]|uniref:M14 family zinc carboxypeptidase n=1 Tax=Nonomuraea sp. NPDC050556 TaxID=3364369 RepID=UPI003794D279
MYRTAQQLDDLVGLLAQALPQYCTLVPLPENSVEGRPIRALRVRRGGGPERRGVLLIGGTHARELMNPDLLVELAVDLINADRTGQDLVLGGRVWPVAELRLMLDVLDLYLLPCVNPDGRAYVMTTDDMWRKNRRDNAGTTCDGVDLNRNADFLWGVTEGQTSCNPCTDVYVGTGATSEPETRNVRHLLDTLRVDCFADVHSYSELVLYPWGHAPAQTTDPSRNFTTLPTGTCRPIGVPGYEEYLSPRDQLRFTTVGQRIVDAIAAVRGRVYKNQSGFDLYGTTGTHGDYAYSRHIANPAQRKVYGYTIEAGPFVGNARDSFHPADPEPIKREVKSGLLALVQQCICAIELLGHELEVDALRKVRDELLGTTEAGRAWIALFEGAQTGLLNVVMTDERRRGRAADLVNRAGRLVGDEGAVLDPDLAGEAAALLRELDPSLEAVSARLEREAGRRVTDVVASLMDEGPV